MDLRQILELARGDNGAFKEIYDLTADRIFSYVLLRTKDRAMALDITQDIFLSLWDALPRFAYISDAHFYAFLWKITRGQLSKARRGTRPTVALEEVFDIPSEEDIHEDYRWLLREVENLKENERLLIELRYFQDQKFEDIAGVLGISENNAKVLHHRAIAKLKEQMKDK